MPILLWPLEQPIIDGSSAGLLTRMTGRSRGGAPVYVRVGGTVVDLPAFEHRIECSAAGALAGIVGKSGGSSSYSKSFADLPAIAGASRGTSVKHGKASGALQGITGAGLGVGIDDEEELLLVALISNSL